MQNKTREWIAANKKKWQKSFFGGVRTIACSMVLAFLLSQFVIANAVVPTGSMENTIKPGDRLLGFRLAYVIGQPHRRDVIIFHAPDEPDGTPYVKRVIGLPGETVEGRAGVVYIDGEALVEPYIKEPAQDDFGPFTVPEGMYFMLGDNRNHSKDSRYWKNPYVAEDQIMARVLVQYYPKFQIFD